MPGGISGALLVRLPEEGLPVRPARQRREERRRAVGGHEARRRRRPAGEGRRRRQPAVGHRLVVLGAHPRDDPRDGGIQPIQKRLRIQAHPYRKNDERGEGGELASVQVLQRFILRVVHLAEHRPLIQIQHVGGAEHDAAGGERRPHLARHEDALQDQELADEAVQRRQADRRHGHHEKDRGIDRHDLRQPAVFGNLTRVPPLVHDADEEEERPRRDAVIELLKDAAGDSHRDSARTCRASPAPCG